MTAGPIASVYVELHAKTDGLRPELESAVDRAFASVEQIVERSTDGIGRALESGLRDSLGGLDNIAHASTEDINAEFRRMVANGGEEFDKLEREGREAFDRIERESEGSTGRIGGHFGRLVGTIGGALAGLAVADTLRDSVTAASDLNESVNAIQVTLGTGADSFLNFGKTAADQLGLTQAALNEAIVPTAAILANAGSSGDVLSGQLQDLATRATDVGSVFNTDVNDVLTAFGAALRGEAEPARQFGVNLSQTALDAKAAELGLIGVGESAEGAAKTQAAYALVMEQTAVAAGDFANTSDGLANTLRRLSATGEELKANLGQAIAPAAAAIAGGLLPVLDQIKPVLAQVGDSLGQVLGAVGPVIGDTLAALAPALDPLADALGSIVTAGAPLLVMLGQLLGQLVPPLARIVGVLADALAPVVDVVVDLAGQLGDLLAPLLVTVGDALKPLVPVIGQVAQVIGQALSERLDALAPVLPALGDAFVQIALALAEILQALLPLLPPFLKLETLLLEKIGAPALVLIAKAIGLIAQALAAVVTAVSGFVQHAVKALGDFFRHLDELPGKAGAVLSAVVGFFTSLPGRIVSALAGLGSALVRLVTTAWGGVTDFLSTAFDTTIEFFSELPGRIIDGLVDLASLLLETFTAAVTGVFEGLTSWGTDTLIPFFVDLPGRLVTALANLASDLLGAFTDMTTGVITGLTGWGTDTLIPFFVDLPGRMVEGLGDLAGTIGGVFLDMAGGVKEKVQTFIGDVVGFVTELPGKISTAATGAFDGILTAFKAPIRSLVGIWNALDFGIHLDFSIPSWVPGIGGRGFHFNVNDIIPDISVPGLADGAFVRSPMLAMIGEAGPEVVIPLSRPARARELAEETGLLRMLAGMAGGRDEAGSLLTIVGPTFHEPVEVDLLVQKIGVLANLRRRRL